MCDGFSLLSVAALMRNSRSNLLFCIFRCVGIARQKWGCFLGFFHKLFLSWEGFLVGVGFPVKLGMTMTIFKKATFLNLEG